MMFFQQGSADKLEISHTDNSYYQNQYSVSVHNVLQKYVLTFL